MGNSNSSTRASKKRKVGEEGEALTTVDLKNDMTSNELGRKLDQSCLQLEYMTQTMQNMQKQMASM